MKKLSKKEEVKTILLDEIHKRGDRRFMTRESASEYILRGNVSSRWGEPMIDVSKSTITRALDDLASDGYIVRYMKYGHCYDYWRYRARKSGDTTQNDDIPY